MKQEIYCCGCASVVNARLTDGAEIYPHRPDLNTLPFWKCDSCGNFVGCHHKTKDRTRPLGNIPTAEIRAARLKIHSLIDPAWKPDRRKRGKLYAEISARLGYSYHTGEIKTIEEAREVYRVARSVVKGSQ